MRRKVRILHLSNGGYIPAFEWETKKKGLTNEVIDYLIGKFSYPSKFPANYYGRSLQAGDRIELTLLEGDSAGRSVTFEMVTSHSYRQV